MNYKLIKTCRILILVAITSFAFLQNQSLAAEENVAVLQTQTPDCDEIKSNIEKFLRGQKAFSENVLRYMDEGDFKKVESFSKSSQSALESAVQWSTVYMALCK